MVLRGVYVSLCASVVKRTNSWSLSVHAIAFHWSTAICFDYGMDSRNWKAEYDSNNVQQKQELGLSVVFTFKVSEDPIQNITTFYR